MTYTHCHRYFGWRCHAKKISWSMVHWKYCQRQKQSKNLWETLRWNNEAVYFWEHKPERRMPQLLHFLRMSSSPCACTWTLLSLDPTNGFVRNVFCIPETILTTDNGLTFVLTTSLTVQDFFVFSHVMFTYYVPGILFFRRRNLFAI